MTRDEALLALDLATNLGYSASLHAGVHPGMVPNPSYSVDISSISLDLERIVDACRATPYAPVCTSLGPSGSIALILRSDLEQQRAMQRLRG